MFVDVPPTSSTIASVTPDVTQRARDRRRRPRVQRAHRRGTEPGRGRWRRRRCASPSPGQSMPAACTPSATNDAVRHGDRQDRGVERGGDRAQLQPVEAAEVGGGAHRQAERRWRARRRPVRCPDRRARTPRRRTPRRRRQHGTGRAQPGRRPPGRPSVTSKNACLHSEALARGDLDVAEPVVRFSTRLRSGRRPIPITPTRRRVALDQCVHRLRGRVRDEIDVVRPDLFGEFGDGLHDAGGDATRRPCASSAPPRWRRSIDP